jgi:hypothetical protein
MKAILINVHDETVKQVEVADDNVLKSWYKLLICSMVQVAHYFNEKDSIMCDEEGLFTMNDDSKFFTVVGGHQPFIGNGLVVGVDPMDGVSVDPCITVEEVRSKVKFHTMNEVTRMV